MTIAVTIFSDFACPYSYLAERSLRRLEPGAVTVSYRAVPQSVQHSADLAGEAWDSLVGAALEDGIELHIPAVLPATQKAHEAAHFARGFEAEEAMRDAIFAACWRDGADIGRIDVLTRLASSIGLDPEDLKIALDIDLHSDAVVADGVLAQRLGIEQTPITYFGSGPGAKVVAGGYTSDQLRTLLSSGDLFTTGING